MYYDHNKKFGLLKFHSGYGKFNLNSRKGYSLKIINAQTALVKHLEALSYLVTELSFVQCDELEHKAFL